MEYDRNKTRFVERGSKKYNKLLKRGYEERGDWMVKPETQPVNVTNEIVQQMDVSSIIAKLNEVIAVMNNFDIQVNLANIHGAINKVAQRINFLEDEKTGYPKMLNLLKNVNTKLQNTNKGIKLLSDRYAELSTSIATGDDKIVQSISNLVNQQKAVIEESNQYLQQVETRLQGIENRPDPFVSLQGIEIKSNPPAIPDIEPLVPTQSEMRIDELMKFMEKQYNDFLQKWLERNDSIQQFVSGKLANAYDEINKRLVESFNRFAPMFRNISNRIALMNMKLVTLGKVVKEEGKATRQQLLDDTNALGEDIDTANKHLFALENGQTQTNKLITDSTGAIVNQLENGQTQTANLLTDGFTTMGNHLADNQTQTTKLLTDGINAVDTHTTNLLTDGINAVGNQLANTQLTRDQLYQQLYDQNMRGIIQNFMDAIWQSYEYLRNQPQIQPVIILDGRDNETVNTSFTPQAID